MRKIAEEVHKSKIEELDKRVLEMEKEHKVMNKTILDCESKISSLNDQLFDATIANTKIQATLDTVLKLGQQEKPKLKKKGGKNA